MLRPVSVRAASKLPIRLWARTLATPSTSKTAFAQTLDEGPSLDDFIAGNASDRVVLGNTSQCVVLSLWICNVTHAIGADLDFRHS